MQGLLRGIHADLRRSCRRSEPPPREMSDSPAMVDQPMERSRRACVLAVARSTVAALLSASPVDSSVEHEAAASCSSLALPVKQGGTTLFKFSRVFFRTPVFAWNETELTHMRHGRVMCLENRTRLAYPREPTRTAAQASCRQLWRLRANATGATTYHSEGRSSLAPTSTFCSHIRWFWEG